MKIQPTTTSNPMIMFNYKTNCKISQEDYSQNDPLYSIM